MTAFLKHARLRDMVARFCSSEHGGPAIMFGLVAVPLILFTGAAVDFSRANNARSLLQSAVDSVALMVAKDDPAGALSSADRLSRAKAIFATIYTPPPGFTIASASDISSVVYTENSSTGERTISVTGVAAVPMVFAQFLGVSQIQVSAKAGSSWANIKLRVAMVLDITGSMNDAGKLAAMKAGAQSLIDQITAGARPGTDDVLIGAVPFNQVVNVGSGYVDESWLDSWTTPRQGMAANSSGTRSLQYNGQPAWEAEPIYMQTSKPSNWASTGPGSNCPFSDSSSSQYRYLCQTGPNIHTTTLRVPTITDAYSGLICPYQDLTRLTYAEGFFYYNGCYTSELSGSTYTHTWVPNPRDSRHWNGCVTDRDQPHDILNTAPTDSSTNFPVLQSTGCPKPLTPLTNDWAGLKANIAALTATGGTNQAIGIAWGWMLLTPGDPFGAGSPLNAPPDSDPVYTYNRAIIVLTDGLNTMNRWYGDGSTPSSQVDQRQSMLCNNIKRDGVTIYAIQVNTGGDARSSILASCASRSADFFYLTRADQILDAFNSIGARLSSLRLSS